MGVLGQKNIPAAVLWNSSEKHWQQKVMKQILILEELPIMLGHYPGTAHHYLVFSAEESVLSLESNTGVESSVA